MDRLFDGIWQRIDNQKLELLANNGSECTVYKYKQSVVKLFKEIYPFSHFTITDIQFLRNIQTKRVLMPTDIVLDETSKLVGYQMPFIDGKKDILNEPMKNILSEMQVIEDDIKLLIDNKVGLMDFGLSNTIYNGKVYMIDPGNYLIDNIEVIIHQIDPLNLCKDSKFLLTKWNFDEANQLFYTLLFLKNKSINSYQRRLIVQFFIKERENRGVFYDLPIYKEYFNPELTVKQATKEFIAKYIKEDPKEREWYLSIFQK